MIKLDLIPVQVYWAAIAVLTLAVGGQQLRVANLKADVATAGNTLSLERTARSTERTARATAALAHTTAVAALQFEHSKQTQLKENDHAAKIKELEAGKRADAATAGRLRDRINSYSASDRRPGETDAAAVQRYADRLGIVSRLLGESVDLVVESRAVIGQRDIEVGRLLAQIQIDRVACTAPAGASGEPKL